MGAVVQQAVQAWRDARPCILKLLGEAQDLLTRLNAAQSHNLSSPQPNKKRKREQNDVRRSPSVELVDDDHQRGDVAESNSKGVASCPICSKPVLLHNINAHLDSGCVQHLVKKNKPKDKPKAVAAWQNILTGEKKGKGKERSGSQDGPSDPLPKLAYNTVKDKVIKDRLSEWDLPTTGDKGILIARHKHWVMLFNANLDKSEKHQRSLKELRRELRIWEEGQKLKKTVVEDPVAHEKRYDGEFKALVAAARPAPRLAQARSPSESSALPPSSPHTRSSPSDGSPNSPSEDEPAS
ncbi:hypothetical protein ONZ45_g19019 [Pleurotus djamor]|nr:hypothetical protein ONZ45_g19019 [Pleurotus djamor]